MLPLSPLKGGSKSDLFVFKKIKFNFNGIKSATKFFLCENFQQKSCNITIPPSNSL